MIVTTTPSIEGKRITRYCGVVAGEAILGANVFKDLFAGLRDIVGGRSGMYERELQKARDIAMLELQQNAQAPGRCFIDTAGWNELAYYPRGIAAIGLLAAIAGLEIDAVEKRMRFRPVRVPMRIPLPALADWKARRAPIG